MTPMTRPSYFVTPPHLSPDPAPLTSMTSLNLRGSESLNHLVSSEYGRSSPCSELWLEMAGVVMWRICTASSIWAACGVWVYVRVCVCVYVCVCVRVCVRGWVYVCVCVAQHLI